jgi:peptidoglycan-associated lipoprotein
MRNSISAVLLIVIASLFAGPGAGAQQTGAASRSSAISGDAAVFYAAERAQPVPGQGNFWFKGGSADLGFTFWRGLGAAISFETSSATQISANVDEKKIAFVAGPRYTRTLWCGKSSGNKLQVFAQGMGGIAHGFDSVYPAAGGATDRATSSALQAGGGFNYIFKNNIGFRLVDAEYVRTTLPNAASDTQNDLRLGAGIVWHFGKQ